MNNLNPRQIAEQLGRLPRADLAQVLAQLSNILSDEADSVRADNPAVAWHLVCASDSACTTARHLTRAGTL